MEFTPWFVLFSVSITLTSSFLWYHVHTLCTHEIVGGWEVILVMYIRTYPCTYRGAYLTTYWLLCTHLDRLILYLVTSSSPHHLAYLCIYLLSVCLWGRGQSGTSPTSYCFKAQPPVPPKLVGPKVLLAKPPWPDRLMPIASLDIWSTISHPTLCRHLTTTQHHRLLVMWLLGGYFFLF